MKLTTATQITLLRIVLVIPFVIFMLDVNDPVSGVRYRYIAIAIFIIMAVSDVLDGYLARINNQCTRLGTFLDPVADKILITCACILLSSPETFIHGFRVPGAVVVIVIGKDILLLLGFMTTYFMTSKIHIVPVWAGKISTFTQSLMVGSVLVGPEMGQIMGGWHYWVRFLWWGTSIMAILAAAIYIRNGMRYIERFEMNQQQ